MSRDEIVERFTLEAVSASPGTFDYAKLDWMNGVYLRALPVDDVRRPARRVGRASMGTTGRPTRVRAAAPLVQEKIGRLDEFPGFAGFLFHDVEPDPALLDAARPPAPPRRALADVEPWTAAAIEAALKRLCEELGEKPRTVFAPIRVAVTGSTDLAGALREPRAARARRRRSSGIAARTARRSARERRAVRRRRVRAAARRATSRSGRRRRGRCASARRRRPSRPRSSRATPISSRASSSRRCRGRGRRRRETGASRSRAFASPARRGSSTASSPSGRTRSRTRCSPLGSRGTASELPLRVGAGAPRRGARLCAARRARRAPCSRCPPSFNDERRDAARRAQRARGRGDRHRRPGARATRREGRRAPADPRRGGRRARREHAGLVTPLARALARPAARRPSATRRPRSAHMAWIRRLSPLEATYTKERSVAVCLATLRALGFDLEAEQGHPPRPRGPAAEVAARLRDRRRSAARRPPDHARAGRPARLRGVPPRGGARAALRGLRPGAAALLPAARARPRAHRDLLVPPRLDLAGARLARRALRPVRRRTRTRTPPAPASRTRCSSAATRRSSATSSSSGHGSRPTARRRRATRSG